MERHTRAGLKLVLGLGVGIGLMVGAVVAAYVPRPALTDDQVRERARVLGMLPVTSLPPAPAVAPAPKEAPPKSVVIFAVVEGMSFDQIAAMLKQTGVLPDAHALTNAGPGAERAGTGEGGRLYDHARPGQTGHV